MGGKRETGKDIQRKDRKGTPFTKLNYKFDESSLPPIPITFHIIQAHKNAFSIFCVTDSDIAVSHYHFS